MNSLAVPVLNSELHRSFAAKDAAQDDMVKDCTHNERARTGCGKTPSNAKGRPQLAKAALIPRALRGAEAPLFHGIACIH